MGDDMETRRGNLDIDLESGGMIGDGRGSEILNLSDDNPGIFLHRAWNSLPVEHLKNGSISGEEGGHSYGQILCDNSVKNAELTDIHSSKVKDSKRNPKGKKAAKEKFKKPKPSKPPRPPKSPSLDAADIKLIKEISEMTLRKHKSLERLSLLRKINKEGKSSAKANVLAMGITVLFFFVIIFHGLLSSNR
ncbi:unnamed protein product [Cuscuta epithymum]|uniref:Uncharacterized protein n=1 Tax=Cuscuta epithymum TaxID=186058 RepID=A0AAV0E8V8_9ASTE|nr:unnamed protein product [Cuscuta epithymum]